MSFIIGLLGLSLMVTIHELGHFIFAKLFKVKVKAFSVGMGPKIFGIQKGDTEYRLSLLPLGGYCAMDGEEDFATAIEKKSTYIVPSEGSLYYIAPWKRLIIALAGPMFNLISAIIIFIFIFAIGTTVSTQSNRIVLFSDYTPSTDVTYPADKAGLKSGDYITKINGNEISYNYQIFENVVFYADKELSLEYSRDGKLYTTTITPTLFKETGEGKIGVYAWVDPIIKTVSIGSRSAEAGLIEGDKIISVNGQKVYNTMDFMAILEKSEKSLNLEVENNNVISKKVILLDEKNKYEIGLGFDYIKTKIPSARLKSIPKGFAEPFTIVQQQIKGFAMLGKLNVNNAVQGPIRITNLIGDVVVNSFSSSFIEGLTNSLKLIAVISVILCFMNLLPIPALDGGLILLSIIETIKRKSLSVKFMKIYQLIGFAVIIGLTILILSNEFIYYIKNLF